MQAQPTAVKCATLVFILTLVTFAGSVSPVRAQYVAYDLGPGQAYDINNARTIVGSTYDGYAFSYSGGVMTSLGLSGTAYGINNYGTIVGEAQHDPYSSQAFSYRNGVLTDLGFGGLYATAYAINDAGTIVGEKRSPYQGNPYILVSEAEIYSGGLARSLGGPGYETAYGINSAGKIVGSTADNRAFITGFPTTLLGTSSTLPVIAYGINDAGTVVGSSNNCAFSYSDGRMTMLSSDATVATHINSAGTIVGSVIWPASHLGGIHAFIYGGGQMTDLTPYLAGLGLGGTSYAQAINDNGDIVGYAYPTNNIWEEPYPYPAEPHAFLLTPIPEPGALALLVLGGVALLHGAVRSCNSSPNRYNRRQDRKRIEPGTMKRATLVFILTLVALAGGISPVRAQYIACDLGPGRACDINNAGTVVGFSGTPQVGYPLVGQVFSYSGGQMTDLGFSGVPYAINNVGTIVGSHSIDASFNTRAFSYSSGRLTDLSLTMTLTAEAHGINDSGTIVGWGQYQSGTVPQFFSCTAGVATYLGPGQAYGINSAGTIVGETAYSRAFSYSNGQLKSLGVLPGASESVAFAINDAGTIVGDSTALLSSHVAFSYSNGQMTSLGMSSSTAFDIDSVGTIVGTSGEHAFVYSGGQITDLAPYLATVGLTGNSYAQAINDRGDIVGQAGGHAFLLVAPEPSATVLLAVGGAALVFRRRQ